MPLLAIMYEKTRGWALIVATSCSSCQAMLDPDECFCPVCGTSVWWRAKFDQSLVGVSGILLEDFDFEPDFAVVGKLVA